VFERSIKDFVWISVQAGWRYNYRFNIDEKEFFRGFVTQGRMNLHIHQQYGQEPHHALEAVFKGVAKALLAAFRFPFRN
jgi:imidazoleglycerol phosphate dehydratase HisB